MLSMLFIISEKWWSLEIGFCRAYVPPSIHSLFLEKVERNLLATVCQRNN